MRATIAAPTVLVASLIQTTLAHSTHNWFPRATNCGPAYGGAVCDAGQCCSANGVCGTGSSCIAPDCLFQYGPACDANQTPPGVNTSSIARPQFGSIPYGVTITKCTTPGKVALTFDDGPYKYTSDMLDLLKANNVKATFFVVANNGGKGQIEDDSTGYPALLRRALNEGHQIGSHTWSHQDLSTLNTQQIREQVIKNEIAFEDIFGFIPTYIRPPYGRCEGACLSTLGSLGYHVINWNLDTNDWKEDYPTSQATFSGAIKASNPSNDNFIVLAHDIHYGTVHGFAQYMIDNLKASGYTTALVGECLGDPSANWYRDAKSGQQWGGVQASSAPTTTSTTSTSTTTSSTSPPPQPSTTSTSTSSTSKTTSPTSTSTSTSSSSSAHTSSSTTTHHSSSSSSSSQHPVITLQPSFQHLNASLANSTQSSSSSHASTSASGGCANNVGACVLQGLGASSTTTSSSTPASSTAARLASATGGASSLFSHEVFCISSISLGLVGVVFAYFT